MGELSETIAPPMKRARRWRTVSFILLILSIALWHWPRGDARFIGQWDLTNYEDGNFAYIGPVQVIEFRRNGRAVFSIVGRGAPEMFPFPWRAESTQIRFGYRPPFRFPVLNDGYSRAMRWMHNAVEPSLREAGYEILSCAENDIWLLESGTRNVVYLHRQGTPRLPRG